MLISYPFLRSQVGEDNTDSIQHAFTGQYPVTSYLEWHNGQHLIAPLEDGTYVPVRAIADGTVIYAVPADAAPSTEKKHAQNYSAFGEGPEWTDKGFVIIKHTTEIGADGDTPTTLTFYSVYAHMKELAVGIARDKKVYRKDVLGKPGSIYNRAGHIHFEICLDDTNIKKLLGQDPANWPDQEATPTKDGRIDAVFGSIYVYLPASTPVQTAAPTSHLRGTSTQTLETPQWVQISYMNNATAGSATLTSYKTDGSVIGSPRTDPEAEYDLYKEANARHNSLGTADKALSSPSGWYELLRFGRNLGRSATDKDPLPSNAAHWRKIVTPTGDKWVDLNATGTFKFSDADFPAIMGWNCFGDDESKDDQRCDSAKLKRLLISDVKDMQERAEALKDPLFLFSQTRNDGIATKLRKAICKFPSEFDQETIDARYGHIKEEEYFKSDVSGNSWKALREHIMALTMKDLPAEYKQAQWHVHPLAFIEQMRKCGWLGSADLRRIYKDTPLPTIDKYIVSLNRMTRKYGFNTIKRLPHILGQGAVESNSLESMQETAQQLITNNGHTVGGSIYPASKQNESELGHWWGEVVSEKVTWYGADKYNSQGTFIARTYNWRMGNLDDPDAQKFRGRGFKQLTGLINYSSYWLYRGWLDKSSFDESWWTDPKYISREKSHMKKRVPSIDNPHEVTARPFNCMDSGGWYMSFQCPEVIRAMDSESLKLPSTSEEIESEARTSKRVTLAINGGDNAWLQRLDKTKAAKKVTHDY